jgi:thioredoxin 1
MVTEIVAPLHFRTLLTGHTYLIADFYATWCPPCKTIAPVYAQLSTAHAAPGKVAFVKVNVDEQREIAAQYGIQAMPTFLVFKNGKQIDEVKGADVRALKRVVEEASKGAKEATVKEEAKKVPEVKKEEVKTEKKAEEEGKTVSGSYGMTGGNSWKMSLH